VLTHSLVRLSNLSEGYSKPFLHVFALLIVSYLLLYHTVNHASLGILSAIVHTLRTSTDSKVHEKRASVSKESGGYLHRLIG
jgi:hypothetical protein